MTTFAPPVAAWHATRDRRAVVLVGFGGGLTLDDPARYAGTAILYGTLPFDAGVPCRCGPAQSLAHRGHQRDEEQPVSHAPQLEIWLHTFDEIATTRATIV